MKTQDIKTKYEKLRKQQKELESQIRNTVVQILKDHPQHCFNLVDCCAYGLIEGCDGWLEDHIYGVRLDENDTVLITCELSFDEKQNTDVPEWIDAISEHSDYFSINWLSVLGSLAFLQDNEEIKSQKETRR